MIGSIVICAYVALFFAYIQIPDDKFHMYFLNIGQGDGMLVRTPDNHQILIDGGPDNKIIGELGAVLPFFDKSIDLVILSHPHADHMNGLIEVLKRYKVENVLLTGVNYNSSDYKEFLAEIKNQNIRFFIAEKSSDFKFGDVIFDVLYPEGQILGRNFKNLNNSSIALRVMYKNKIILLTGDLESEAEAELIARYGNLLKADVFKAGHHGSRYSSSLSLFQKIQPTIAVIQSGNNNINLGIHTRKL